MRATMSWRRKSHGLLISAITPIRPAASSSTSSSVGMSCSRSSASGLVRNGPRSGSEPVEREVVEDDERAVARGLHVELDVVGAELDRTLERGQRVLLLLRGRAPVGDDQRHGRSVTRRARAATLAHLALHPRRAERRARTALPAASATRRSCMSGHVPIASPASAAAPRAVASASAATSTGLPIRSAWNCIRKRFAARAAVGAQHAGADREHVEHVGDLVRDRLERRAHEMGARRPAGEAADQPARVGVPVRRAEARSARARRRRRRSSRLRGRAARSRPRRRSRRGRRAATAPRRRRRGPRPRPRTALGAPGAAAAAVFSSPAGVGPGGVPEVGEHERAGAVRRLRPRPARSSPGRRAPPAGRRRSPRRERSRPSSVASATIPDEGTTSAGSARSTPKSSRSSSSQLPGVEVEQHRPRRVRHVGDVRRPARQLPDQPRVDRPEGELPLRARGAGEDPLELRRREVRVADEAGALADELRRAAPRSGRPCAGPARRSRGARAARSRAPRRPSSPAGS